MKQEAKRHLNRAEKLFWDIEVERLIGGHGRTGILPTFLEAERKRNLEVQPRYFEVEFGPSVRSEPTRSTTRQHGGDNGWRSRLVREN